MGRKITIFMLDGVPTGPKTVEIGNWSGKAIYSPRATLKKLISRDEFDHPGVYILRGESSNQKFIDSVYIGEAEELRSRLKQHIADRDFEAVICFISKDDLLTKAHVKYLESRLVSMAIDAGRSVVENSNKPKLTRLSEADISDMEYFLEQIELVLPSVGIHTLVNVVEHIANETIVDTNICDQISYRIKSKEIVATMLESSDKFIVLKDSEAVENVNKSISQGWKRIRDKLLSDKTLQKKGKKLVFLEDTMFSSPSAAASVILGRQAPGPLLWLDKSGKTYKENQEK